MACICEVHNEGNTPNFGERTGKLIGIDGGNIRLGGCRILVNKNKIYQIFITKY